MRAKPSNHLPVVLSRTAVRSILQHVQGTERLVRMLLYGTGMRVMEVVRLRIKAENATVANVVIGCTAA